ncbi:MAG: hypothetical protein WBE13_10775, partial [Candidatus Acidiferrum sp.]
TSICRSSVTICSGLYFLVGIPALLQSEFSLTSAGTKNPGQVTTVAVPLTQPKQWRHIMSRRKNENSFSMLFLAVL